MSKANIYNKAFQRIRAEIAEAKVLLDNRNITHKEYIELIDKIELEFHEICESIDLQIGNQEFQDILQQLLNNRKI